MNVTCTHDSLMQLDDEFFKVDMVDKKCECCEYKADHILVIVEERVLAVFQICYQCSIGIDLGDKKYRFIPKMMRPSTPQNSSYPIMENIKEKRKAMNK